MSFLNSDQYASATTRLLDIIDDRMPRRHQLITAAIVVFLALGSIASSLSSRPAPAAVQDKRPIILIATPSPLPTGAAGLAKRAAPLGALAASIPTATPLPTDVPEPVIIVVVVTPTVEPPPTAAPEPTAAPMPPTPIGPTGKPSRWTIR